jgi:hypothetical protein
MKVLWMTIMVSGMLFAGCAGTAPPSELIFARAAYVHISSGQAQDLVPAEVLKAENALVLAERSFQADPRSFETRDLAYAASRMAHRAEVLGFTAASHAATVSAALSTGRIDAEKTEAARAKHAGPVQVGPPASDRLYFGLFPGGDEEAWSMVMAQADLFQPAEIRDDPCGLSVALSDDVLIALGIYRWRMWARMW